MRDEMKNLSILLTTICLFAAPVLANAGPRAANFQKIEINVGDAGSQLMGVEITMNNNDILQIHVDPLQSELFSPQIFSTLRDKELEQIILKEWEHKAEEGIHTLRFNLPQGVFMMTVLGKNKTPWPDNTYIDKNGQIRRASHEGRYTFSISDADKISVLPGDSVAPKRKVTIRKYLMITNKCLGSLENIITVR